MDQLTEPRNMYNSIIFLCALLPNSGVDSGTFPISTWSIPATDGGPAMSWKGHAFLESPGGNLDFGLDVRFAYAGDRVSAKAWIFNGRQRDEVPAEVHVGSAEPDHVGLNGGRIVLRFEQYDAEITADIKAGGIVRLDGQWRKRRTRDEWVTLPFHATFTEAKDSGPRAPSKSDAERIAGRWAATFGKESSPAVGVFEAVADHTITGTFLTPSGDYGFLSGWFRDDRLYLSSFDGAHALLFKASMKPEGTLAGDFWAGDRHHETWSARRDPDASLPDAFTLTKVNDRANLADLVFPDVHGTRLALTDEKLAGKARLIQIFGTWCPNCHDEAAYLSELDARYRDRGLSIVGLAFELTGDAERDARQVRKYVERHQIKYPVLIAGTRERAKAGDAFPLLDRIAAYPTTIFLHSDGRVRAVHTGFSGPAAPEDHRRLRRNFETIIEELLSE